MVLFVRTSSTRDSVMRDFENAVAQVEHAAGGTLPPEYREWLRQHRPGPSDHRQTPFDLEELLKTQRRMAARYDLALYSQRNSHWLGPTLTEVLSDLQVTPMFKIFGTAIG